MQHQAADFSWRVIAEVSRADTSEVVYLLRCVSPILGTYPTSKCCRRTSAVGGGLNQSMQHSNLLAEMECGHEAATSHLLFCGSAV
jgi:hypothetical protein